MITADKLNQLINIDRKELAFILDRSGYSMCAFEDVEFLGITNGGQFCYKVTYFDEMGTGEEETGKVFVKYDHATQAMTADF